MIKSKQDPGKSTKKKKKTKKEAKQMKGAFAKMKLSTVRKREPEKAIPKLVHYMSRRKVSDMRSSFFSRKDAVN